MLRLETQRENLVVSTIFILMGFSILLGLVSIFTPSNTDKAFYHFEQAQFYQAKFKGIDKAPIDLIYMSEKETLQALVYAPYDASLWSLLAAVSKDNQRYHASHKALGFAYRLSVAQPIEPVNTYKLAAYNP